jgi:YD repeat-containing protein
LKVRGRQESEYAVEYHYDTEERLIGVTNQRGERYTLRRDALGRIVEEIDYWGQARRYAYSAAGHLKESTDPLDRLPDPYQPDSVQVETFAYDPNGNLTAAANDHIQLERKFNAEGRLVEERQGTTYVVTNSYDANGNRILRTTKTLVCGQVHSNTVRYTYDALDQAIAVEVERHDPVQLMRNGLGQVISEALSSSLQRRFEYSPDGYLAAQRVVEAERPVLEQTFHHDGAGNLVERDDSVFGIEQYRYDSIGRLVAHFDPHGRLRRYLNDPAGDRLRTHVRSNAAESPGVTHWCRYGEYDGVNAERQTANPERSIEECLSNFSNSGRSTALRFGHLAAVARRATDSREFWSHR